jgi:hypothetical protein
MKAITGMALIERDAGGVPTLGKFDWGAGAVVDSPTHDKCSGK